MGKPGLRVHCVVLVERIKQWSIDWRIYPKLNVNISVRKSSVVLFVDRLLFYSNFRLPFFQGVEIVVRRSRNCSSHLELSSLSISSFFQNVFFSLRISFVMMVYSTWNFVLVIRSIWNVRVIPSGLCLSPQRASRNVPWMIFIVVVSNHHVNTAHVYLNDEKDIRICFVVVIRVLQVNSVSKKSTIFVRV